jgi:hypothetical protein
MQFLLQTKVARREPKQIPNHRVICHLPDFCHNSRVLCLRIARTAASNSLQLCELCLFVPYMFAGTLNAQLPSNKVKAT